MLWQTVIHGVEDLMVYLISREVVEMIEHDLECLSLVMRHNGLDIFQDKYFGTTGTNGPQAFKKQVPPLVFESPPFPEHRKRLAWESTHIEIYIFRQLPMIPSRHVVVQFFGFVIAQYTFADHGINLG